MDKYYIGVDGGGTKTQAVLIDANRKIIRRAFSGGSNPSVFGIKTSIERIYDAVYKVTLGKLSDVPACLAIAGLNSQEDKKNFYNNLFKNKKLSKILAKSSIVVNDTVAALRSATVDKNAIVLISGTGSNCWGRNEKGEEAKAGGLDYILSDEGSGYAIGLSILKSVVWALDGRGPKTILVDLLFKKLNVKNLDTLSNLIYKKPWNKTDIASIAPLAGKAAFLKDDVAEKIIFNAASDLGLMIKTVAKRLGLQNKKYMIVRTGSVFKIQKILCECLEKDILKFSPKAVFTKQKVNSATGAAFLALEKIKN